ncbi:MAG: type VI secretion system contractile sheath small subunit, partial [Pseudomonadales bacterium]|nr:type VI secretion system contractile sheath small subunit [Pseudomonadales bacterium]
MELGFTSGPVTKQRKPETPFRILVMGDFSGRENREICEPDTIAQRPLIPVDIDRFDTVLDTLAPRIQIKGSGPDEPDMEFEFRDIGHFHPDHLYREQQLFQVLRQTHARLSDPKTFAETAQKLSAGLSGQPEPEHPIIQQQAVASSDNEHDSFASLIEGNVKPSLSENNPPNLSSLINKIMAPYIQPDSDPRQSEVLDSVEQATGEQLRKLLHHPCFQSIEATWRSLYNLITT